MKKRFVLLGVSVLVLTVCGNLYAAEGGASAILKVGIDLPGDVEASGYGQELEGDSEVGFSIVQPSAVLIGRCRHYLVYQYCAQCRIPCQHKPILGNTLESRPRKSHSR